MIFFCEKCPDSPLYPKHDLVRQIRIDQAVYDVILSIKVDKIEHLSGIDGQADTLIAIELVKDRSLKIVF